MDRLWAPWRMAYLQGHATEAAVQPHPTAWRVGADEGCFLCRAAASESAHDRTLGIVERTPRSVVVVNRYPYGGGHLLLAPLDHRASLGALADDVLLDLQRQLVRWTGLLERSLHAQGFNVGLNLGTVAGAGVPGHLHWHLLPRWQGDVNFMPALAEVRVISQSLDDLRDQLAAAAAQSPPRP